MFKDQDSAPIVAVRDLDRAKAFYGQTLGLELDPRSMGDVAVYKTGKTRLGVYVSDFAGTNQANAVTWSVGDELEAIATDLASRGVTFEHYEMDGVTFENGIHHMGDFRMVWFKDPDGNILHINSGD